MSKYIQPWYPSLFLLSLQNNRAGHSSTDLQRMDTVKPDEPAHLSRKSQSRSEALDLLRLQDYVCNLSHTQQALETTCTALQRTDLLSGIISEQDLRTLRTACLCTHSLRIRVEARANTAERAVIDQQIQFMQTTVQPYPTEDLRTADTSCPSRTSAEHFT